MTAARRALAALAAVALLGCGGGDPPPPRTVVLEAVSAAIEGVNAARARTVADATALLDGARAVDAVDRAAAVGDKTAAKRAHDAAEPKVAAASRSGTALAASVTAYGGALDRLTAAAEQEGLEPAQRAAVDAVVTAARAEALAVGELARTAQQSWPAYRALYDAQRTWLVRARGGWYRSTRESTDAYAVLTDRTAVERARAALVRADGGRASAAARVAAAVTRARAVLDAGN